MYKNDYAVTATVRFIVPADSEDEASTDVQGLFEGIRIVETCKVTDVQEI